MNIEVFEFFLVCLISSVNHEKLTKCLPNKQNLPDLEHIDRFFSFVLIPIYALSFSNGGSYMYPFWNHILGLYMERFAKIVATWKLAKLAKKKCIQFLGSWTRDQFAVAIVVVTPPTTPPPPWVAILFIYQTRIGYIWIHTFCRMYEFIGHRIEFIGHRVYEFILLKYEFISGREFFYILRDFLRSKNLTSCPDQAAPGCPDR